MQTQPALPRLRTKLVFWLLLGMLSTALAEVTVASQVAPFFSIEGWLIVFPVYALHILVLGYLVAVRNKPTVALVWTAGILFGFYEFLITKVLWNPPWTDAPFQIAGVAIPELLVIGLFYHALMAFMVPLWVGESALTVSRSIPLPDRLARFLSGKRLFLLSGTFGFVVGATAQDQLLLSVTSFAVVAVGVFWWRRTGPRKWTLAQLLPDRRQIRWVTGLLVVYYAIATVALRPENLPGLSGWVAMLVLYAGAVSLFVRLERQPLDSDLTPVAIHPPRSLLIPAIAGAVVGAALPSPIGTAAMVLIIWGGGALFGLAMLWGAIRAALRAVPDRVS